MAVCYYACGPAIDAITDVFNQRGRNRIGDTGLGKLPDKAISKGARDKTKSGKDRNRYRKEEKRREKRNKQKRKNRDGRIRSGGGQCQR